MRTHSLVALLMVVWLVGCTSGPRDIVIFHTNDIHGRFLPEPKVVEGDTTWVGGFVSLSGHLSALRALHPTSIYLDAGDLMTGNPICNIEYEGIAGGALLELLRLIDLDALTMGNHEFDQGADHAIAFAATAKFPCLCANLVNRETREPVFEPYVVLRENGLRIGVIGLVLDDLHEVVAKSGIAPFEILGGAQTAQRYIDEIDPRTDLIVLLTHNGLDGDRVLASQIENADVIIGGHSHHRLDHPELVNGIIIAQAGAYCKDLGVLRLTVAGDSVSDYSGEVAKLAVDSLKALPAVASLVDSLQSVIAEQYGEVIGELRIPLTRSYFQTSALGNWLCDLLRARYDVDVAVANSGGIRKDLEAGPITRLDIVELLPFQNSVVTFEATGSDLMKMAREQARAQGMEAHGILQMSGMRIKYRKQDDIVTVDEVLIGNRLLAADRVYTVAAHDYITVSQPHHYLRFEPHDAYLMGEILSDAIIQQILVTDQPMSADPRSRMERIR